MPSLTNAILAQKVSDLLDSWRNRELEMRDWIAGAADGGPYGDGRFPLTDYLGVVRYTYSPAALEAGVASSAAASSSSAADAAASLLSAVAAQAAAEGARDTAQGFSDAAQAARDLALNYKNQAATSAAQALSSKTAAASSATAAAGSATDASTSATAAAGSASAASSSASAAAASAAAAAASAVAAATFDPANFYTKTAADARFAQLTGAAFSGVVSVDSPGNFQLKPGGSDHVYMGFYARTATPTTRTGFFGFASGGTSDITLANEISGGHILFTTTGVGVVKVNGTAVSLAGHTHAASDITSGVLATARLGTGTASNQFFLRGDGTWSNTLSGSLNLNGGGNTLINYGDNAYVSFYNTAGTTRTGYIQFNAGSSLWIDNENGGGLTNLAIGGTPMLQINSNAVETRKGIRATGWYGTNGTLGGPALELGYLGSTALAVAYDRSTSTYQPFSIQGTDISLSPQGGHVSIDNALWVNTSGNSATARNIEFRTAGQPLVAYGTYSGSWRPSLTIQGDTSSHYLFVVGPDAAGNGSFIKSTRAIGVYVAGSNVLNFTTANGIDVTDRIYAGGEVHGVGYRYNVDTNFYFFNSSGYTYGSWRVGGSRNGYVGLILDDPAGQSWTYMANSSGGVGVYAQASSRWAWYDNATNFLVSKPIVRGNGSGTAPYLCMTTGGSASGGNITVSTSTPSGTPADGDLWFQRAA